MFDREKRRKLLEHDLFNFLKYRSLIFRGHIRSLGVVAGYGGAWIAGRDDRTNVGSTDASPITIFTPAASGYTIRLMATIEGYSGTVTSGVYTIKYTLDTVTITQTISISAVDTVSSLNQIIHPDSGSNVTVQITTLTGTTPKVNVACYIEQLLPQVY